MSDNKPYPYHLIPTDEDIQKWKDVIKKVEQERRMNELLDYPWDEDPENRKGE